MTQPTLTINTEIEIDYGQLYIYSESPYANDPGNDAVPRALKDARMSRRWVGVADGLIDLVVPFRKSFNAPMRVEVWPGRPPSDEDNWDHVVDVDLDVTNDRLVFEPSGGLDSLRSEQTVPSGAYRVRVCGRGYTEADGGAEGTDSYRLQLWPRTGNTESQLRKSWPGWQNKTG